MVQAVASFFYWIYEALVYIGFSEATAIAIIDFGIKIAAAAALSAAYASIKGTPDFSNAIEGTTVTTRETLSHQRIIYGETLVSGPIWHINNTGQDARELHISILLAGHEIEDITEIYLDSTRIESGYISWGVGDGPVNSGDFRGDINEDPVAFFEKFLGAPGQAASPL